LVFIVVGEVFYVRYKYSVFNTLCQKHSEGVHCFALTLHVKSSTD